MKCPVCGQEMEPGYLQSDRQILFTTQRPMASGVPFPHIARRKDLRLTPAVTSPFTCPAWHCSQCGQVLVKYR